MKSTIKKIYFKEIKENVYFYTSLTLSLLTSLFLFEHFSETFTEFGKFKWIFIISAIISVAILIFVIIFGYIFLVVYTLKSIIKKLKKKQILSSIGTIFQFLFIIAMTWPIPMIVIKIFAKVYFNITIPNLL